MSNDLLISDWGFRTDILVCDGKCEKAWGVAQRPRLKLDDNNLDDVVFLADDELEEAPRDPGTYEGSHGKPHNYDDPQRHNKWCQRQCERSCCYESEDEIDEDEVRKFEERVYNQPWKHEKEE